MKMEILRLKLWYAYNKRVMVFLECLLFLISVVVVVMCDITRPAMELLLAFAAARVITEGLNYFELLQRLELVERYRLWPIT